MLEDWERPLHAAAQRHLPQGEFARPGRITEVADGDALEFGDGARVVWMPGHTAGNIAVLLPGHGVLFTGDCAAASPVDGAVLPGVFHHDRPQALASFRRLALLDTDMACFGHGDPVTAGASAVLRKAADAHPDPRQADQGSPMPAEALRRVPSP